MKKVFILLLTFVMVALTATAYDFQVDGICYNIDGSKASVTYETEHYNSYSGDVTIPSTVTHDGKTYSVTSIGKSAFTHCGSLTSLTKTMPSVTALA